LTRLSFFPHTILKKQSTSEVIEEKSEKSNRSTHQHDDDRSLNGGSGALTNSAHVNPPLLEGQALLNSRRREAKVK
jgi:hypothetical protein